MQLPQPKDGRLTLEVAGGEVAAVLKFEGSATKEATLRAVDKLKGLIASGVTTHAVFTGCIPPPNVLPVLLVAICLPSSRWEMF